MTSVAPDTPGQQGRIGTEEAAKPFGLAHMPSQKAGCMRKMGQEMKGKNVVWAF